MRAIALGKDSGYFFCRSCLRRLRGFAGSVAPATSGFGAAAGFASLYTDEFHCFSIMEEDLALAGERCIFFSDNRRI